MSEQATTSAVSMEIDGRPHEAEAGQLVIAACEDAGVYVPHFCYHPRMRSVGMCRQCLVEVEGPRGPTMVVSCMTTVAEGQIVRTATDAVRKAQEGVLEFLLANHPLDCPVCDKGGECPLQDQAFSHGPGESRFVEEKRHYEKPIPISDLVYLDRERCILCDRCTRFADEVAGDPLIHFTHRGANTQVLTYPDEPFSSYFSGNTVQICPVGALTASPYRFKARPWDLEQVESTCTTCSVGCRVVVQSSRNQLVRYQGVDSDPVNWGWLCDKGRFAFEALQSDERLGGPLVRGGDGELAPTSWPEALDAAAGLLRDALDDGGPSSVAILGGARGTNEDAFAWALLAREVLGTAHVDAQMADGLPVEVLGLPAATIDQVTGATTIVVLGLDLKEELPVLYLRVRDSLVARRSRLVEVTPMATGLSSLAWREVRYRPGEQAAALAQALAEPELAAQLAKGGVAVVVGRGNLAESAHLTLDALRVLLDACPEARVLPGLRRGNVRGALTVGLTPGEGGLDAVGILEAAAQGRLGCLVLLGADPVTDVADRDLARRGLAGARAVVAVDTVLGASSRQADVVLAAAGFGEKSGTTTNLEGRVSTVAAKVTPPGTARADWQLAAELAWRLDADLGVTTLADLQARMAEAVPGFDGLAAGAGRGDGVVLAAPVTGSLPASGLGAPTANAYDFRLVVSRALYDAGTAVRLSPHLAPLARPEELHLHPRDLERLGVDEGGPVTVATPRASVVLPAVGDTRVARGSAWVPFPTADSAVASLLDATVPVVDVRVESR